MKVAETIRKSRRKGQEGKAKRMDKYIQKRSNRTQPGRQGQRPEDGSAAGGN